MNNSIPDYISNEAYMNEERAIMCIAHLRDKIKSYKGKIKQAQEDEDRNGVNMYSYLVTDAELRISQLTLYLMG